VRRRWLSLEVVTLLAAAFCGTALQEVVTVNGLLIVVTARLIDVAFITS